MEFLGAGEIQQRGFGGDLRSGDTLLSAVDGLRFGKFLLRDLRGERLDAALREVATAFDGLALRFEVVEEVRVVVLDLDDELALLHPLTFGDVQVLHAARNLRFDVDAAVERIEGDHATGTGDKLPPRQPKDGDDEDDEAEHEQAAEDAGELRTASERESGERWGGGGESHGAAGLENDETRMKKEESMPKPERRAQAGTAAIFVIRHSGFIRHSSF